MNSVPYYSVWGKISDTREDPNNLGCILVTIAGQTLRFRRNSDDGMEEMGLLRLTKRKKTVFLIFWENKSDGRHCLTAGWNNPDSLCVRKVQSIINETPDMLELLIPEYFPTWKDWDVDEFVECGEAGP